MAINLKTFAAIDVGSYELEMKIFEMSTKIGIREIDCIRHQLALGTDTYTTGKISHEKVDELCRILREFKKIMEGYHVDAYKAYGTSAIREMENTMIVLDQIAIRTGIRVEVLSNSEQRFLDYKSVACKGSDFDQIIEEGTAILDIGGGSIQISLFEKDTLVTTQNLRLGVLRIQDRLSHMNVKPSQYEHLVEEMISSQLNVFKKMYIKDKTYSNIIVVDDYVSAMVDKHAVGDEHRFVDSMEGQRFMEYVRSHPGHEIARSLDIPEENVQLSFISSILIHKIRELMDADKLWIPGVTLCDGMAYEYAEKNRLMSQTHDFEQDILACTRNISKRYMGSKKRSETLEQIALNIFDSMKKIHGLGKRERLLLRLAALLHDCGKYISMVNLGECSYSIIMSTEIIGLSHTEREIIANVVKYNHVAFDYYEVIGKFSTLDKESYLTIAKLTAILRLANGLDRSHKQKFRDVKIALKDQELIISVDGKVDVALEKGLFYNRADFFAEVFSVRPKIKQK